MSRNINSTYQNAIAAAVVYPADFVELYFASGTLYLWSGIGNKSWSSQTWTGTGGLLSVSEFNESESLAARSITIGLNGLSSSIVSLALAETPYQGRTANIYKNIMSDATTSSTVAASYLVMEGKMSVLEWTDSGNTVDMTLEIEDKLNDLFRAREIRYTDQDQRVLFPSDNGLEYVTGLQTKNIVGDISATDTGSTSNFLVNSRRRIFGY